MTSCYTRLRTQISVSYTHLDVYKRQVLGGNFLRKYREEPMETEQEDEKGLKWRKCKKVVGKRRVGNKYTERR